MNLSLKKRLEGTPAQERALAISLLAAKILAEKRKAAAKG